MKLSFDFSPERRFYTMRFQPGAHESAPFLRELRFWGVDRTPCPQLSTLAALMALKTHPMIALTLSEAAISPPVSAALAQHFGVEIHAEKYDVNRRDLAGGARIVSPVRFGQTTDPFDGAEVLTWTSLDDLRGPFGGQIRTNIDAFDLDENEKNLIVALCCSGKELGHVVQNLGDDHRSILHRIGLELIQTSAKA